VGFHHTDLRGFEFGILQSGLNCGTVTGNRGSYEIFSPKSVVVKSYPFNYSVNGIASAVAQIRSSFLELPMLIGGAGGYQPDTFTPEIWSNAVLAAGTVKRVQTKRHYFDLAGIDLDDDQQLEDLYAAIIDTLNKSQEEGEES
jgi:hypothetical protein